jgi:hypothetical protein
MGRGEFVRWKVVARLDGWRVADQCQTPVAVPACPSLYGRTRLAKCRTEVPTLLGVENRTVAICIIRMPVPGCVTGPDCC